MPTFQNYTNGALSGRTGGEIFHEMMVRQVLVGYPGGAILPVFDAIYNSPNFNFIVPRHEQGGGHMAEGYARASGKPGVILVTSGPGATNIITPMQDAMSDGTPIVVFCGQVPTTVIGTGAFQEADMVGISRPCSKWSYRVQDVAELPLSIIKAFKIATSGRPGPVLIELPKDITIKTFTYTALDQRIAALLSVPSYTRPKSIPDGVYRLARLISVTQRPVIYAGQGIMARPDGPRLLKELADKASIPVTTTLLGLGAYDELDPKSLRMLGMHGTGYANMAIQEADLIIAIGARFDDRVTGDLSTFAPKAREAAVEGCGGIAHFDVQNIGKIVPVTIAIEGDCIDNLAHLLPLVDDIPDRYEWFTQIMSWKTQYPLSLYTKEDADGPIKPQVVIERLSDLTATLKSATVITTGVGQHQMFAAQHYRWRSPRTLITSGGLGTMGFGLPAAIGAKVARPDALVIDIDGDASFNMTLTELSTAMQYNIDIKVLILNNSELGMVTQWQDLFYNHRYSHTHLRNPDFVLLAQAMGLQAQRCTRPSEVRKSLEWLINSKGAALLEVRTDSKVAVLPMVPPGASLHEFIV
ncbi:thiamine diphosphate-binding protein [Xylogone sp. PMI_703]|nr:thiamine diphosphate-binding protein [Xylogone sp. PMI_703]